MKRKLLSISAILCVLLVAILCIHTLMGQKEESPLIGAWNCNQSILGYTPVSEAPDKVIVSFYHENQGQEWRENTSPTAKSDAKTAPFYYSIENGTLTVWQGTMMNTYHYSLTINGELEILTLKTDDGNAIILDRLSDRPLGVR